MTPAVVWDVSDLNLLWQIKYLGEKRSVGYNFIVRDNAHRADFMFFVVQTSTEFGTERVWAEVYNLHKWLDSIQSLDIQNFDILETFKNISRHFTFIRVHNEFRIFRVFGVSRIFSCFRIIIGWLRKARE